MLSKNQIKLLTRLDKKKYRNTYKLFVVEGIKSILEFLNSDFELENLYTVENRFQLTESKIQLINESELRKISFLTSPNIALATFKIVEPRPINEDRLIVALDNINDPGNLGTIIRLCDWFGIQDLICNLKTVDCYNPKVVQASMGSMTRVNITYLDLEDYLKSNKVKPVYGAFMDGPQVYSANLESSGILILGNEANGISNSIEDLITTKITIPQFNRTHKTESLNVATATAILLSEFKRRTIER
jgi:TrmH family RNA methyltransferase